AHSAATSRRMNIASDSSQSRWLRVMTALMGVSFLSALSMSVTARASGGPGRDLDDPVAGMQAASLRVRRLPPPAAGPHVLARAHGARTRFAADGRVALVVQRVVGDAQRADHVPHIGLAPGRQRV